MRAGDFLRWLFGPLIGFSFAGVVFLTSIFGNYIVTLFLPMITVLNRHRQWREMMDRAIPFWMTIPLYAIEDLPTGETELKSWLNSVWLEKEKRLDEFYSQKAKNKRKFEVDGEMNIWLRDQPRQAFVKIFGFCFWIGVCCIWLYHLTFMPFVRCGLYFLLVNYVYIYLCYGGIDHLIFARYERWARNRRSFVV
ncbi:Acyltransf-C domain-containing protein [Aphelenchoides fujianensis]|nr:Acyltransf-C domain-containing protein [Aphelenchoides fujianensis]